MAKLNTGVILLIFSSLLTSMFTGSLARKSSSFLKTKVVGGNFKVSKLHFYVQDIAGGASPTVYEVARASITGNSSSRFGQVKVMDHKVTAGPEQGSAELGRVQGLITGADLAVMGFATNINFYFTVGEYNGSTLSIVGRNQISDASRELPVVGGTGFFRFASGYTFYVKSGLQNIAHEFE